MIAGHLPVSVPITQTGNVSSGKPAVLAALQYISTLIAVFLTVQANFTGTRKNGLLILKT